MKKQPNCVIVTFHAIFVAIFITFFFKGVLLITRYGMRSTSIKCEQDYNHTNTTAAAAKLNHEFIFTTTIYGILSVLRFLEYFLLYKQFYYFIFKQKKVDVKHFFKKHSKRFFYLPLFITILFPYFLLGFAIPGLGIYQEIEHAARVADCYRHYQEIYITYCAVNFLRYMSAFGVRIMMIYTALSLNKIWFPEHSGAPLHTSIGLVKPRPSATNASARSRNIQATISQNATVNKSQNQARIQTGSENNDSEAIAGNPKCQKVLDDWKAVTIDFQERTKEYTHISKQVQAVEDLFQTWFILPWVVYLVASSLKTYNILRPWNADGDGDTPPSDIPHIYYLLYNINQLITLIVPFLCAKKMNTYHQKYFKLMRDDQLKKFEDDSSRLSFARQLMIDRDTSNDFVPRIVGTSITIPIGSPLFVVILLAGTFLSVSESLLT